MKRPDILAFACSYLWAAVICSAGKRILQSTTTERGLSLEPASANLGRKIFGNRISSEAWVPRSVSLATRGATNHGTLASFAVCLWNLLLSKVCLRNLLLPRLRRKNFGGRKFCEALALRSVWLAAWDAQNCGKFVALAVCLWNSLPPTWAAKILGTEILAKQWRHAAFRSQRGGPNIVLSWLHSRFAFGTFFFQALPLEPSSSKVAPRKFCGQEFLQRNVFGDDVFLFPTGAIFSGVGFLFKHSSTKIIGFGGPFCRMIPDWQYI